MRIASALVTLTALLLVACSTPSAEPDEAPRSPANYERAALANTAFAIDLYNQIDRQKRDGNFIYSPLSISTALAMTSAGARAQTQTQIVDALRFADPDGLHAEYGGLIRDLEIEAPEADPDGTEADEEDAAPILSIPNSLWVQMGLTIGVDFLRVVEEDYDAQMRQLDFRADPEGSREVINGWVSDQTYELIPELLPRGLITPLTRLVLVNALYLRASWQVPFDENRTEEADFTTGDGTVVQAEMMGVRHQLNHVDDRDRTAVELPLADTSLSMVAVLPRRESPQELIASMRPGDLGDLVDQMSSSHADLRFPKFEMRTQLPLNEQLQALGIVDAWDADTADFSRMAREDDLYLSDVIHEATITVDEKGLEAAAATAAVIAVRSAPTEVAELTFDEPFAFFIRDNDSGAILFVGQVLDPTESN